MVPLAPVIGPFIIDAADQIHRDTPRRFGGVYRLHFLWLWFGAYCYGLGLITPVARYYTFQFGTPATADESGQKRREKGLARAGNARVRRGMVELAWRWLMFQKDSALAHWFRARTASARGDLRKTMIVALARKLLIAL